MASETRGEVGRVRLQVGVGAGGRAGDALVEVRRLPQHARVDAARLGELLLAAAAGVGDRAAELPAGDPDAHRPDAAAGGGLGRRRSTVGAAACEARGGQECREQRGALHRPPIGAVSAKLEPFGSAAVHAGRGQPDARAEVGERLDDLRIELRPGAARDLRRRRPRRVNDSLYGRSWTSTSNTSATCTSRPASGIVVARQAVGVAGAVPALVVGARDLLGGLEQLRLAVREHARAEHGVRLDDLELLVGEAAGLEQDRVGDRDLADVVQRRGVADAGRRRAPTSPSRAAEPGGQRGRRARVCSCVLSSRYSAASASRRSVSMRADSSVAPARDGLRGERRLEVAHAARRSAARLEQRAQPRAARRAVVGAAERRRAPSTGGPASQLERVEPRRAARPRRRRSRRSRRAARRAPPGPPPRRRRRSAVTCGSPRRPAARASAWAASGSAARDRAPRVPAQRRRPYSTHHGGHVRRPAPRHRSSPATASRRGSAAAAWASSTAPST